jgi:hypothetical protein
MTTKTREEKYLELEELVISLIKKIEENANTEICALYRKMFSDAIPYLYNSLGLNMSGYTDYWFARGNYFIELGPSSSKKLNYFIYDDSHAVKSCWGVRHTLKDAIDRLRYCISHINDPDEEFYRYKLRSGYSSNMKQEEVEKYVHSWKKRKIDKILTDLDLDNYDPNVSQIITDYAY